MPRPLPRFFNREQMIEEQRQALNRVLAEVDAEHDEPKTVAGATLPRDARRLEGSRRSVAMFRAPSSAATRSRRCSRRNGNANAGGSARDAGASARWLERFSLAEIRELTAGIWSLHGESWSGTGPEEPIIDDSE